MRLYHEHHTYRSLQIPRIAQRRYSWLREWNVTEERYRYPVSPRLLPNKRCNPISLQFEIKRCNPVKKRCNPVSPRFEFKRCNPVSPRLLRDTFKRCNPANKRCNPVSPEHHTLFWTLLSQTSHSEHRTLLWTPHSIMNMMFITLLWTWCS